MRTRAVEGAPHADVKHAALHRQQDGAGGVMPRVLAQLDQREVSDLA